MSDASESGRAAAADLAGGGTTSSEPPGPATVSVRAVGGQRADAVHADQTVYISHRCGGGNSWIGVVLLVIDPGEEPVAVYASYTPDEAREHAANLLRIANKLDGGKLDQ
ncbi:MAG TPA: hypothetical protein VGW34_09480 [Allosphingosinicella sp.]|nr:hypothetical protein [Allosphingosinicella sp.]